MKYYCWNKQHYPAEVEVAFSKIFSEILFRHICRMRISRRRADRRDARIGKPICFSTTVHLS